MDKKSLQTLIKRETVMIWDTLCEIYSPLVHFNEPIVELNNRFWRTAGICFQDENRIQLATKFFLAKTEYRKHMLNVILPHEVIHQADYNLFGISEKNCGHGEKWCEIMVKYGLPAEKYHNMEILRK
jgi:predicted SprT family Zn-dependent metalloprotease